MATRALGEVVRYIRRLAGPDPTSESDAQLLARFAREGDQAAFAALVERHGRLVLGACRRILRREQDAEDVFQATFLVLVKKAPLTGTNSLAAWLYIVARRLALKAQAQALRQREYERLVARPVLESKPEPVDGELLAILEEELQALPEKYRAPLVLCHLEGRTHEQAAQDLGWPSGSLWKRLQRGRHLLRDRLVRRGFSLSAGILTAAWLATPTEVPAALAPETVRLASLLASASSVPPHLAGLVQGALRAASYGRWKITVAALIVGLIGGTAEVVFRSTAEPPVSSAPATQVAVANVPSALPDRELVVSPPRTRGTYTEYRHSDEKECQRFRCSFPAPRPLRQLEEDSSVWQFVVARWWFPLADGVWNDYLHLPPRECRTVVRSLPVVEGRAPANESRRACEPEEAAENMNRSS